MYILLEGVVEMRKANTAASSAAGLADGDDEVPTTTTTIAKFVPTDERPWFGEQSLFTHNKQRTCSAVCAETSKALIVRAADFPRFLEIVPSFQAMFVSSAAAYAALAAMRRTMESADDILKFGLEPISAPPLDEPDRGDLSSRTIHVLDRWRSVVLGLLAKRRLQVAADEEQTSKVPPPGSPRGGATERGGRSVRRVSYVAGMAGGPPPLRLAAVGPGRE